MMRISCMKLPNRAGARVFTILALVACFAFGSVQAADSGLRRHAEGAYDAASGVYMVVKDDDLSAIAERFGANVAEWLAVTRLPSRPGSTRR